MNTSFKDVDKKLISYGQLTDCDSKLISSLSLPAGIINRSGKLVAFNRGFSQRLPNIKSAQDLSNFVSELSFSGHTIETSDLCLWNLAYPATAYHSATKSSYVFNAAKLASTQSETLLLIIEDATAQISAQKRRLSIHEQLLHTARTLSVGEMSTVLAHELNQPLATISNYLAIVKKLILRNAPQEQAISAVVFAQEQTRQASEIISRIREFVKTREPKFNRCSPLSLLEKPLSLLQVNINDQQIKVAIKQDETLPDILADRIMLEQVFANLIRNAIESMSQTPATQRKLKVYITKTNDQGIAIRLSDTGCGISTAQQTKLFSPFFSTKDSGMGVGLSICRSIIELHGGRLYLESSAEQNSDAECHGSTFVCTLPAAESCFVQTKSPRLSEQNSIKN